MDSGNLNSDPHVCTTSLLAQWTKSMALLFSLCPFYICIHDQPWMLCCLELSSAKWLTLLLSDLASLKFPGHKQTQIDSSHDYNKNGLYFDSKSLVPFWSLSSDLTVHISVGFQIPTRVAVKLYLQHSAASLAQTSKLFNIPLVNQFRRVKNLMVRFLRPTMPLLATNFLY